MRASRSLDVLEARNFSQPGPTGAGRARPSITLLVLTLALLSAACGGSGDPTPGVAADPGGDEIFTIGAIPDQDPEVLQRLYGTVAGYLAKELAVAVEYVPVADYGAAVNLFRAGDRDMVWFGGLTGVQAR
ncbi:MAG TPA: PhnD/SsuA/transferrin family substrate-binding protein, partial [Acidimicrobiales bacterium]|nr:PhnD/SsuA/transferrin family substrate-binding protein [Acidimicrobiales bacterium]